MFRRSYIVIIKSSNMRSHSFCLNPFILKHATRHQDVVLYQLYFQEFLDHTTDARTTDNAPRNDLGLGRQNRFFFSKGGNSRILSQEVLRSVLFLLRRRVSSRRYLLLLICRCFSFVFNNHVFR